MDLLGDLTRSGKEGKSNDRTWANIKSFLNNWMSRADEIYEYLRLQEPLIGLFRKGAVHRFFPIGCGITRHKGYDSVLHGDDGCLILNVQAFASDFIDAIAELSKRVAEGQNKDSIETMHEKLLGGIDDYKDTVQAQIPALVRKINPPPVPDFGRTEISGSLSGLVPEGLTIDTVTTTTTFGEMELTYMAPPRDWLK